MTTKTCSRCREEKPVGRFPLRKDQADGLHFWCMSCKREKDREYGARYRTADPERIGLGQFNDDPDLLAAAAAYTLSLRDVLPSVGQPNQSCP